MDASILITVEKGVLTCTENFQKENVVFFLVEREKDELNTISFFNNCFFFFFADSTSLFVQSDSFRLKNLPFVHSRVFCCVLSFTVVK